MLLPAAKRGDAAASLLMTRRGRGGEQGAAAVWLPCLRRSAADSAREASVALEAPPPPAAPGDPHRRHPTPEVSPCKLSI